MAHIDLNNDKPGIVGLFHLILKPPNRYANWQKHC